MGGEAGQGLNLSWQGCELVARRVSEGRPSVPRSRVGLLASMRFARLLEHGEAHVVTYEYEKDRLRDGQSVGKRTMTLTLSDFGRYSVSDLPDNR